MNFIALTKEISLHPLNVRKATEGEAEEKLSKFINLVHIQEQ